MLKEGTPWKGQGAKPLVLRKKYYFGDRYGVEGEGLVH